MSKSIYIDVAKLAAKNLTGSDNSNMLTNSQLIEVVAQMIESASKNPDIEVISQKLKRNARNENY